MRKGLIRTRYADALWLVLLYTKMVLRNKKKKEKTAFFHRYNEYSSMCSGLVHTANEKTVERYLKTIGAQIFDRQRDDYICNIKELLPFMLFFSSTFFDFTEEPEASFLKYLKQNLADHGHSEEYERLVKALDNAHLLIDRIYTEHVIKMEKTK